VIVDSTDPIGPAEGLFNEAFYRSCLEALRNGGILVQQSESRSLHLDLIKSMRNAMRAAGFQPCAPCRSRSRAIRAAGGAARMARKGIDLSGFRERGSATKQFETRYYNVDMHRAALAQPEFMRDVLGD
jgi:spermidine synthase